MNWRNALIKIAFRRIFHVDKADIVAFHPKTTYV